MTSRRLEPIHPGEILEEEFMRPLGLSANGLARRIDVPVTRISEIVRGNRGITADTAVRLARLFGTSSELWLGLQAEHDLRVAQRDASRAIQSRIVPLKRPASKYGERASSVRSRVGERTESYGAGPSNARTRDRRRIRRPPSGRENPHREKEAFFEVVDRLARSSDPAEQKRLKAKLARMIFHT
jgi:addiction module HigA family antidote